MVVKINNHKTVIVPLRDQSGISPHSKHIVNRNKYESLRTRFPLYKIPLCSILKRNIVPKAPEAEPHRKHSSVYERSSSLLLNNNFNPTAKKSISSDNSICK